MNQWQKIAFVCVCGGCVWGLSYASSIWPEYALVCSSFATGVTALSSILAGFPAKENE